MKTSALLTLFCILGSSLNAEVPSTLNYQGRIMQNGQVFDGTGHFVFVIYEGGAIRWSNKTGFNPEATDPPPNWISAGKALTVRNGVFAAQLGAGDANGTNEPISTSVFFNFDGNQGVRTDAKLKVWFSPMADGPYVKLDPDINFASVPFAQVAGVAEKLQDGAVLTASIADGTITGENLSAGAVIGNLGEADTLISPNSSDIQLEASGYVRYGDAVSVAGSQRYLYRRAAPAVNAFTVTAQGGLSLNSGQSQPLDFSQISGSPQQIVLVLSNVGNRQLSGLSASCSGPDASGYVLRLSTSTLPVGTVASLVVSLAPNTFRSGQLSTLKISVDQLPGTFDLNIIAPANAPSGFATVPGGSFVMGRTSGDLYSDWDAVPVTVTVSTFALQQKEVSRLQWDEVKQWAVTNGYTDLGSVAGAGTGKADNHPVSKVSWWDAVKWCNARSEKEGLTPCYILASTGGVFRTGTIVPSVKWSANGYRLPTEAEWEKAARGGVSGKRYPWGTDTISHAQANYRSLNTDYGNLSGGAGYHPDYAIGSLPYTSAVGSFDPNAYGLFDMAGNVSEWCWDWYAQDYYGTSGGLVDPRGPVAGDYGQRVRRGGDWEYYIAGFARCSARARDYPGEMSNGTLGFRPARSKP